MDTVPTQSDNPITEPSQPAQELAPLTILRTETVLSKYPIHNLAKKGTVNIQITKKNDKGKVDFIWKVSPNPAYGLPRQLAYKLDTLVINRHLDEEGRPLPRSIKLGSLRDLSRELGLMRGDTADVKKALLQNASTFITAKLKYRGTDGSEKDLEAGFSRYSIVFTGEKLPDGRKADAVYIILNEPYWEVLNNAPVRPLNYDYLRELQPGPQRFYEIVSYRIYAAFKFRNPEARLKYSDYCTFSAQQRYFDYDHFKKQMYKVHRPHLASGYLAKVRYEPTTDAENRTDWLMCYIPGPKARAEYHAFTKRPITISPATDPEAEAGESPVLSALKHQTASAPARESPVAERPVQIQPAVSSAPAESPVSPDLVAELTRRGILETRARKLLEHLTEGQEIIDQLEWGDYLIAQAQPGSFRNPPGFYISLVRDNIIPPITFENSRRQALREERERAHQQWLFEEQQLRFDYDRYRDHEKERYIRENLSEQRYHELFQAKRQQFKRQYARLPEQTITDMAHGAIRGEMEPHITFLGFEQWKKQQPLRPVEPGQGSGETSASVSGTPAELPSQTGATNPATGT